MAEELRKANRAPDAKLTEDQLEDDGRGWCGIRTYITGPASVVSGHTAEYRSNVQLDTDPGCKSAEVDEVAWSVTDMPTQYKDFIHVSQQSNEACKLKVEAGVQSGTQFTLHAIPKGHAVGKGASGRIGCQVNKADAQVITVSQPA